jgi:hypothetical protein
MLAIEFTDTMRMSYRNFGIPRFLAGDQTELVNEAPSQSPGEQSRGSDDVSRSRSTPPTTGQRHPLMPGFMSHIAVGFGIAKAISEAQRA